MHRITGFCQIDSDLWLFIVGSHYPKVISRDEVGIRKMQIDVNEFPGLRQNQAFMSTPHPGSPYLHIHLLYIIKHTSDILLLF